ncbi:hypothetical protein J008_04471 [Cryptococcus neoformans]|nr:hypothetical protein J008_04471 [Cryptococcus neoformans var. grubii]
MPDRLCRGRFLRRRRRHQRKQRARAPHHLDNRFGPLYVLRQQIFCYYT